MNPGTDPSFAHIATRDAVDILSTSPLLILLYTVGEGMILDANRTFETKFSLSLPSIRGVRLCEAAFIPDVERETMAAELTSTENPLSEKEMNLLNSSGDTLSLRVSTYPVNVDGTPCMLALGMDITNLLQTERKLENKHDELEATNEELLAAVDELERTNDELTRAYWELKENEDRFKNFFEENHDGMVIVDNKVKIQSCNRAFASLLGYDDPRDMKGLNLKDITPAEYYDIEKNMVQDGIRRNDPSDFYNKEYIRRDGKHIPVSIQAWLLKDKSGQTSGMWAIVRDRSENISTELSIGETLKLIETAIRELPVAVIISEVVTGKFFLVNELFEKTTGYSRQDAVGKTAEEMDLFANPSDKGRILDYARRNRRGVPISLSFKARDGHIFFCLVSSSLIKLRTRDFLLLAIQDITPLRDMESQREKLQNQMSHIQKMEAIGTLASGLAHDFNNILGGIVGSLELIRRVLNRGQVEQKETLNNYINTALSSCSRATDLTRQLLSLTRRTEMQMMPVDLGLSLKHVAKLCAGSFPKSVEIQTSIPSTPARVMADPAAIEQVLINLCVNGNQAMTEMRAEDERQGGTLRMSVDMSCSPPADEPVYPDMDISRTYARIIIEDSGVGIPADIMPRIFDPFFTTRQRQKGTGLGLTIAYNTAKQHGGFITTRSTPGEGSVFSVYIPTIQDVCIEPGPDESQAVQGKGTILVIDDEKELLTVTAEMLSLCGYEPLTAGRAEDGINIFRERHVDISAVIVDMSMPGMSGLDVFRTLKSVDPEAKVLLASGYGMMEQVEKAMKDGAGGFLNKPFSMSDLTGKLKCLLNQ